MGLSGGLAANGGLSGSVVNGALAQATPGLFLPPDWGTFWKPKRNAAGSAQAKVAVVGDSVGRGYYSSNLNTKGWAALLRASLQTAYGDGGSGFQGVVDSDFAMNSVGVTSAARTAYTAQKVGATGTWAILGDYGPGAVLMYSTAAGTTLTFSARGTSVTLFYWQAAGQGTLNWTIDGSAQTPIATAGASSVQKVTASSLSSGTHSVVVTNPAAATIGVFGVNGDNATGVTVNNYSKYGAVSAIWNDSTANGTAAEWSGGISNPADLVIYALGVNDASGSVTGDVWAKNLAKYLWQVRATANPQTDVLILLNHVGGQDASYFYQDYVARARGIAEAYGAALLDMWRLGRNSWAYWQNLGYWSVADGTGGAGSDTVHPSDVGHAYISAQLLPILQAA